MCSPCVHSTELGDPVGVNLQRGHPTTNRATSLRNNIASDVKNPWRGLTSIDPTRTISKWVDATLGRCPSVIVFELGVLAGDDYVTAYIRDEGATFPRR